MEKICANCCQMINGIEFVTCRGYCGGIFHLQCAGQSVVTRALLGYFSSHRKNLFWMCDECAELFSNSHLRSITKVADEKSPLAALTEAITNLQSEIKQLSSRPTSLTMSPAVKRWPSLEPVRAAKRLRGPDVTQKSSECQSGSKQIGNDVVSVAISTKPAPKFWLYLSRIRPDVTNGEISAMVRANLQLTQDPDVVKLVPKGADIGNMTFISFKVGLDPALKSKAMDPSSWPEGIMFREFEEITVQKFRKPPVINLTPTSITPPVDAMQN
ncbi:uncharacterized protein LOC129766414 [Toxorhynchites rutilus septentrionalis]|uniref:uncharacterized protein LOC129766414 n=1 Tax=Toxorhynchites rutilus septentrionalis TaxID=329112 RepID=UPI002479F2F5|nr:uncharacterized protein LOC129766414 [Toxorhynchites rutilus septentrionalis]